MARSALALPVLLILLASCGDPPDDRDMGAVAQDTALAGDTAGTSTGAPASETGAGTTPDDAGPAAVPGRAASYEALRAEACDTIANSFRCARAIEDRVLGRAERVTRSGDTLRLALSAGDTATLVDRSRGDHSDRVYFSYQDHWPDRGFFLVQRQYYEGSAFLLIDDGTGERTALPDWPIRSPEGRRFAVLSLDLVAGYGPNTLQIWDFEDGSPTLQWETNPTQWGPKDGRWLAPDTLFLTQHGYCGEIGGQGREMCDREVLLVGREGGVWDLVVSAPRAGSPAPRPRRSRPRRRRTPTRGPR